MTHNIDFACLDFTDDILDNLSEDNQTSHSLRSSGTSFPPQSQMTCEDNFTNEVQICTPPFQTEGKINNKKAQWKIEEDRQVIELYNTHGPKWTVMAKIMKTRTKKQIRDRYLNLLRPDINYGDWTREEENRLAALHEKHGNKWSKIAAEMPGRTEYQVKSKLYYSNRKGSDPVNEALDKEQSNNIALTQGNVDNQAFCALSSICNMNIDTKLKVNTELDFNCLDFSEELLTCNPQALRGLEEDQADEISSLSESAFLQRSKKIRKDKITTTESTAAQTHGPSSHDSTKTTIETKHNKNKSRATWKPEEDVQVVEFYNMYGPRWTYIASIMKTRTSKQIRDRYLNALRPDISYVEWTPEEENLLVVLHKKHGNKWCKIAAEMPGRTEDQVKNKFNHLNKNQMVKKPVSKKDLKTAGDQLEAAQGSAETQCTDGFFLATEEDELTFQQVGSVFKDSFDDVNLEMRKRFDFEF